MKEYTEKEILNKAEAYCSAVERCPSDVEAKLKLLRLWLICSRKSILIQ